MELTEIKIAGRRSSEQKLLNEDSSSKNTGTTFDGLLNKIGLGTYHWKAWIMMGFLGWADGSESMVLSFTIPIFTELFKPDFNFEAWLGTGVYIGYMIGSFFSGFFADHYGRKRPLIHASLLMVIVCLISAYPPGVISFIWLRSLYGIINGIYFPIPVAYLAEITPAKHRGKFMTCLGINYTFGEMIACILAIFTLENLGKGNWHALLAWATLPGILCWIASRFFMDESPRYQMIKGEYQSGISILKKMHKENNKTDRELLTPKQENELIDHFKENAMKEDNPQDQEWKKALKIILGKDLLRVTVLTWLNWIINCLTFNGVTYILPSVLEELNEESGQGGEYSAMSVMYSVLGEIPVVFLILLIVDMKSFGRRNSMALSFLIGGLCCLLASMNFYPGIIFWISVTKLFFNLAFSLNYQITSEVYPTKVRATGMGLASAIGRIGGIIMPVTCSWLSTIGILVPFRMFGIASMLAGLLTYSLPYDTTGLEMDSIDLRKPN